MQRPGDPPEPFLIDLRDPVSDPAFLTALCHDLRGPLGAIGTWVHVLASGRADEATQQQALAAMQRDVAAQSRLLEQLADLASLLGGTLSISIEEIDLIALLADLGAELRTRVSPRPMVLADLKRLRQIFAILLPAILPATGAADGKSPAPVLTADDEEPGGLILRGVMRKGGAGVVGLTLAQALADAQGGRLAVTPTPESTLFAIQLRVPG